MSVVTGPRRSSLAASAASAGALVAVLAGFPLLLWALAGWPLPHGVPTWSEVATDLGDGYFPDRLWIGLLALAGWVAWAQLVMAVAVEALATAGRRPSEPSLLVAAPARRLAQRLVGSAALAAALLSPRAAMAHVVPDQPPATASAAVAAQAPPAATEASAPAPPVYVVEPWAESRDCLWNIAERHLGDGLRWREIWELNRGRTQPDGGNLEDPGVIRPGWHLELPHDAVGLPPPAVAEPMASLPPVGGAAPTDASPPPTAPPFLDPAQPAPAVPTTAAVAAPRTERSAASPQENRRAASPGRGTMRVAQALALGLPVLAAGGLVAYLDRRRRIQVGRHQPGQGIVTPDPALEPLERRARAVAVDEAAAWVDAVLRVLVGRLRAAELTAPVITCVRAGQLGIEVLLAEPAPVAPPGFDVVDGGHVWRLDPDAELAQLRAEGDEHAPASPALVSVGCSPEGPLLVDLEGIGVLSVEGAAERVAAFLAGVALELTCATWAEGIDLHLFGADPGLAPAERVTVHEDLEEVVELAERAARGAAASLEACPSTLAGRVAEPAEGWAPTVVVVGGKHDPALLERLAAAARPGSGVVVVAEGPVRAASWRLHVVDDGYARLDPVGLAIRVAGAPEGMATNLAGLDGEAIAGAAALVSAAAEEGVDAALASIPTDTRARPAITLRRRTPEIWVNVLGPVTFTGLAKPLGSRRKLAEVLAYLGTHDGPVPGERIRAAVWPDEDIDAKSFREAVSRLRTVVGVERLPAAKGGAYQLSDDIVGRDWAWFRELSAAAAAAPDVDDSMALWREALELVRGEPFGGTIGDEGPFVWSVSELLVYEMQVAVTKAADALAELALGAGDPELAMWATSRGHLATPSQLSLFDWQMRAAAVTGDLDGLDLAFRSRRKAERTLDPASDLPAEIVALYERLRRQIVAGERARSVS
ncbi:MAG TPA: hypothetical protein VFJ85_14670 [Acidimicrobiales bacterium]|nr:hypothetical protein [Acidimicrobiales bacterium]